MESSKRQKYSICRLSYITTVFKTWSHLPQTYCQIICSFTINVTSDGDKNHTDHWTLFQNLICTFKDSLKS